MSVVKIQGNANGNGTITFAAPNTDTDRNITIPDSAGELLLANGDGSNLTGITTGKVLQVVNGRTATNFNTSSSSYVDTNLYGNITPSSTSSKILILVDQAGFCSGNSGNYEVWYNICRGTTVINENRIQYTSASDWQFAANNGKYLDSPSTTSSVQYKTQVKIDSNTAGIYMNWSTGSYSNMILMEIAG